MSHARLLLRLFVCGFLALGAGAAQADAIVAPSESDVAAAREAYTEGLRALDEGRLDMGERLLKRARELAPNNVSPLVALAEVARRRGDVKAAESLLRQAVAEGPDLVEGHVGLTRLLRGQGRSPEAIAAGERAVGVAPDSAEAHAELAFAYLQNAPDLEKADREFAAAARLAPEDVNVQLGLATTRAALGKTEEAERALLEAQRVDSRNLAVYDALGRFYLTQGDARRALQAYDEAIRLEPGWIVGLEARGDILRDLKEYPKAVESYRAALDVDPKRGETYLHIGMLEQARHNLGDAEAAYRKVIELAPQNAIAYNNLASLTAETGRNLDQGLTWALKAVELGPEFAPFHDTLAWVQRARADRAAAIATLEKAVRLRTSTPLIVYHLGVVYDEIGRRADAVKAFKSALAANPNFSEAAQATKRVAELEAKN